MFALARFSEAGTRWHANDYKQALSCLNTHTHTHTHTHTRHPHTHTHDTGTHTHTHTLTHTHTHIHTHTHTPVRVIVFDRLSVVLWLDKGDFPENLHTVSRRVKINKRSFEPAFRVWVMFKNASSHSVSDFF